ncbi:uncharacterized protein METZ01_LOCUS230891, partial [marine metagenome]
MEMVKKWLLIVAAVVFVCDERFPCRWVS